MFDAVLSLIAPHTCLQCAADGSLWCDLCSTQALPAAERCYKCHALAAGGKTCKACKRKSPIFSVQAATRYEGHAKRLIWKLKFERARAASHPIGLVMSSRISLPVDGVLVHIPTATSRVRRRGYDQAQLIARQLSSLTGLPHRTLLMHLGQKQQHGASRAQRLVQLEDAFRMVRADQITGRHVILVDDVITTGATLEAAARALKIAGAKRVSAVVFAQA